jgi:cell division protein FtsL
MDIPRPWTSSPTEEAAVVDRDASRTDPNGMRPRLMDSGEVELSSLGGYALVILIMAACMLLSAWSRIDLRETAVALDRSERDYAKAEAETSRLKLELSTLEDPAWLAQTADELSLQPTVSVVEMSTVK